MDISRLKETLSISLVRSGFTVLLLEILACDLFNCAFAHDTFLNRIDYTKS